MSPFSKIWGGGGGKALPAPSWKRVVEVIEESCIWTPPPGLRDMEVMVEYGCSGACTTNGSSLPCKGNEIFFRTIQLLNTDPIQITIASQHIGSRSSDGSSTSFGDYLTIKGGKGSLKPNSFTNMIYVSVASATATGIASSFYGKWGSVGEKTSEFALQSINGGTAQNGEEISNKEVGVLILSYEIPG